MLHRNIKIPNALSVALVVGHRTMKSLFRTMLKAGRLSRAGRPLSAALALGMLLSPSPPPKKKAKKSGAKRKREVSTSSRPVPGSFSVGEFAVEGGRLRYKLYMPTGSARRRLPLVVMLHGCGQSATDFAMGTGMNALADEFGFLVLYPEQSSTANLARCWNWHRPGNQKRGAGEPATIAALTRKVIVDCNANPSRVYVAGISAGGAAAAILATAYPELFVALGVHSGLEHGDVGSVGAALSVMRNGIGTVRRGKRSPPPPMIIFHGDADMVVHPSNAGGFLDHLRLSSPRALSATVLRGRSDGGRDFTRTTHRYADGPVLLQEWTIHGGGHAWSGGSRAGSYTDPSGPEASREMIRFFLARRRAVAIRKQRAAETGL
jgi:poly(hydroxyalkanoate) depolymerase family esterase